MRTVIKNGTLVTASDTVLADLWIDDGKIVAQTQTGNTDLPKADKEIDAKGKYVIPGGIDVHTHLDMPFGGTQTIDDFESGTIAAAHGGTTTLVDYAIQSKGESLRKGLDTWHAKAEGKAAIDYGFHLIMLDAPDERLDEMAEVVEAGVTSFKVFAAYPGALMLEDDEIFKVMLRAGEVGALVCIHAEVGHPIDVLIQREVAKGNTTPFYHGVSRPEVAEASATERAIALAEMAGAPLYVVHLTNRRALDRVKEARERGLPVMAETCPQYLYLTDEDLRGTKEDPFLGSRYVCSPPVRQAHGNREPLWRALAHDHLQVVSTDHCSFNLEGQKELGREVFTKIPNGMPSIESRLHLMYQGVAEGRISLNRFVELTSTAPAKIFGMYPHKGTLAVGADADVVVWDPNAPLVLDQKNMHLRCDYSPYEGHEVPGSASQVLSRGELIVDGGSFLGKAGRGKFVRRAPFRA